MTRRMVADDQEVFRVVVRRKKRIANPDYRQGNRQPYWILLDEEYNTEYGPYSKLGAARGVETQKAYEVRYDDSTGGYNSRAARRWDVVDSWIEKVEKIVWKKVED